MRPHALSSCLVAICFPIAARAEITLIGKAAIPGDALDKCPFSETMSGGVPQNRLGGFGSGIDYTGADDLYIACVDRGPADGAAPFRDRLESIRIRIDANSPTPVRAELVATTMLLDGIGTRLTGCATAFSETDQPTGCRFDPEGIRVGTDGRVWISDEYGPWIDEFSRDGRRTRRLAVPQKFRIAHPSADAAEELPPTNTRGRQPNRGFEGLAISPDRARLWAILQSPLLQDGALSAKGERIGRNIRVLQIDPANGAAAEYVYPLEHSTHGVNECLAFASGEMLVLERDGKPGEKARSRALYRIGTREATDVSAIESLPSTGLPEGVRPVSKALWLDFMDPRFGLAGASMPEKIEGLAFGPALPDGRRTLIVTTDNDFRADQPSWIWVFAFGASDLSVESK